MKEVLHFLTARWCPLLWLTVSTICALSRNEKHSDSLLIWLLAIHQKANQCTLWQPVYCVQKFAFHIRTQPYNQTLHFYFMPVLFTKPKFAHVWWKLNPSQTELTAFKWSYIDEFKSALSNWKDHHIFPCSFSLYHIKVLKVIVNLRGIMRPRD